MLKLSLRKKNKKREEITRRTHEEECASKTKDCHGGNELDKTEKQKVSQGDLKSRRGEESSRK